MTNLRLNASEREIVRPFVIDDSVFNDCSILYSKEIGFDNNHTIILDDVTIDALRLRLNLPVKKVCSTFDAEPVDLSVSIIAMDQSQRNYQVIHECRLDEIGETPDLLDRLPLNLALGNLSISVLLTRKLDGSDVSSFNKLAQKEFKFRGLNQKIDFPRIWKTADEFKAAGLPKTALWHLSWIGEDLDKAVNELVVLWLNSDYKTQLQIIGASSKEEAFQRLWASAIMADLARTVLRRGVTEDGTSSITFQTIDSHFIGRFYQDHDELKALTQRSDFASMVSAWTQDMVSLSDIVEKKRA